MSSRIRHCCKGYAGVFYVEIPRPFGSTLEKVFYIRYRRGGKQIEEKVGHQYRDRMTPVRAAGIRAARIEGREPSNAERRAAEKAAKEAERNKPTIARLWEVYQQAHNGRPGNQADVSNYKKLVSRFSRLTPEEISTADVDTLRNTLLRAGKSPQTVKHIMGLLRRIIRYAVRQGLCPQPDPARLRFDMPKVDNSKTECLTPDQARALLTALDEEPDQDLAALVRLALATGMRRGALLGLQWEDIDFLRGFITLRGAVAKKRKTETIPLTDQARVILSRIHRTKSPYVFPGKDGGPRKGLRRMLARVKKKAGLPEDFRPLHGLRHTFASWLASSGQVDLYTLQRLLTHESPVMTQRYAHLADDRLRRAAAVADDLYQEVLKK